MHARIGAMVALAVTAGSASADIINLAGVPDMSQHSGLAWQNYCAPTAGVNVVYYFGQTHAGLLRGDTHPGTTPFADDAIAGPTSPPPLPGSMADMMGTTTTGGTSASGVLSGLDQYLEDYWDGTPGGSDWSTIYRDAGISGGSAFWNDLQNDLRAGAGVVLLIAWFGGVPDGYDTPDGYVPDVMPESALGHAVTMTGFDLDTDPANPTLSINDPQNNAGNLHNFGGEGAAYVVGVNPFDLSINLSGSPATIYGAVVTIPGPAGWVLLGLGGISMASRRRRYKTM